MFSSSDSTHDNTQVTSPTFNDLLKMKDLREYLAVQHLSMADLVNLAKVSSNARNFFSTGEGSLLPWRQLVMKHFGIQLHANENARLAFYDCHTAESERLIAYCQVFIHSFERSPIPTNDFLSRLPRHAEILPEANLSKLLLLRSYSAYVNNANKFLSGVDPKVLAGRDKLLRSIINSFFHSSVDHTNLVIDSIADDLLDLVVNFNSAIDFNTQEGMMVLMISALGKCGAYRSLQMLVNKLNDVNKQNILDSCGINLCRDAAKFGHANIVQMFFSDDACEVGLKADSPAAYSVLFDDKELRVLPATIMSLKSLCCLAELPLMDSPSRLVILKDYQKTVNLLCHFGVNPSLPRLIHTQEAFGAGVSSIGSSHELAERTLKMMTRLRVYHEDDINIIRESLIHITDMKALDQYERYTEDKLASRKTMRDEFTDNGSDEEIEELKSPSKKTKSSPQSSLDDDGVFFVDESETMDFSNDNNAEETGDDQSILSPLRNALSRQLKF